MPVLASEATTLRAWRLQHFMAIGFARSDAYKLADSHVDYHQLEQLVKSGCAPELARRILDDLE